MPAETPRPSFARRALRAMLNTTLTLTVIGASGAAVFYGSQTLAERAEDVAVIETADLMPVSVSPLFVEDGYTLPRQFVGQVEAAASVVMSFELGGRLSELLVEEGDTVVAGQIIGRLDTARLDAEYQRLMASRAATEAQLECAETRLVRAQSLRETGFASQEALDQALATRDELLNRVAEIEAGLATVAINLEKSVLTAPFDGRVGTQSVDGGETLAGGTPVVTLIETAEPRVRIGLPLTLDPASLTDVEITVNGGTYPATLTQVRPDVDPVTRTRTAIFTVATDGAPIFGQTATLRLDTHISTPGTWVPLDALQEGAGGTWTVLVVEDDIVRLAAAEILHTQETRAYVRGTFAPGALMIQNGAHRVVPGQQVRILAPGA